MSNTGRPLGETRRPRRQHLDLVDRAQQRMRLGASCPESSDARRGSARRTCLRRAPSEARGHEATRDRCRRSRRGAARSRRADGCRCLSIRDCGDRPSFPTPAAGGLAALRGPLASSTSSTESSSDPRRSAATWMISCCPFRADTPNTSASDRPRGGADAAVDGDRRRQRLRGGDGVVALALEDLGIRAERDLYAVDRRARQTLHLHRCRRAHASRGGRRFVPNVFPSRLAPWILHCRCGGAPTAQREYARQHGHFADRGAIHVLPAAIGVGVRDTHEERPVLRRAIDEQRIASFHEVVVRRQHPCRQARAPTLSRPPASRSPRRPRGRRGHGRCWPLTR